MVGLATFAGGPFTTLEAAFHDRYGVLDTAVGYTGGWTPNPSYGAVGTGETGHAESVRVEFDPSRISYGELLEIFWTAHDATASGPGRHRSAIFCHSPAQLGAARVSRDRVRATRARSVTTDVVRAGPFYRAEEVHQRAFLRTALATPVAPAAAR